MKAKFLNHVKSFCWKDKIVDRSLPLQDFNLVINEARKNHDLVFCPSTMYENEYESIFIFMWINSYQSYDQLKVHYEWLKIEDFEILLYLHTILGTPTPRSSNVWEEFNNEFKMNNISLIGLKDDECMDPLVYDSPSYIKHHSNFVRTFDFTQQKYNFEYFRKYYKPELKISHGVIKAMIERNQVNSGIIRLDSPTTSPNGDPIHGQQIHVHILIEKKNCALNIDGSWKHPPTNILNDKIPAEICLTLSDWGFKLPEEYY